jgi:hypothetical protein
MMRLLYLWDAHQHLERKHTDDAVAALNDVDAQVSTETQQTPVKSALAPIRQWYMRRATVEAAISGVYE